MLSIYQGLSVRKLDDRAILPVCANPNSDLGYDLFALEDQNLMVGVINMVDTGIAVSLPGYGFIIKDRSSMASRGIFTHGGVIDEGYRGSISVMFSTWLGIYKVSAGDKIAQLVPIRVATIFKVQEVENLPESVRGDAGFGSTGSSFKNYNQISMDAGDL